MRYSPGALFGGEHSPYLKVDREIQLQQYTQPVEAGHTWLFLKMKPPASKELKKEVAYVTGQLVIYEEQASLAATILPVQGVFLRKMGKLTLFGNSPDSSVQLLYRKTKQATLSSNTTAATTVSVKEKTKLTARSDADTEETDEELDEEAAEEEGATLHKQPITSRGELLNLGVLDGVPVVENMGDYDSIDVSPPRYSYVSRFRSSDSFSDQCVSIVEMSLVNSSGVMNGHNGVDDEDEDATDVLARSMRNMKLTGTLASVNCGLYLTIDASFQEENLNMFFAKASRYAVIMTFIAMGEIYFLLRQLQISSTQATAAKVSLLTIGQQAIVDSYLCLGHLTIGIVAQVYCAVILVVRCRVVWALTCSLRRLDTERVCGIRVGRVRQAHHLLGLRNAISTHYLEGASPPGLLGRLAVPTSRAHDALLAVLSVAAGRALSVLQLLGAFVMSG